MAEECQGAQRYEMVESPEIYAEAKAIYQSPVACQLSM